MAKKNNKDKSLVNQYIRAIENPDSIGFRNGRWYQSPRSGDDPNSRGFGIDVKYNNDASNAEFMQRLRNNDKRAIHNPDGSYSTHVLGSADNIVFPAIQDVNGKLKDFRAMPWQRTLDWAIRNKDYIEFPTEGDARYFGEHYKKYYPEFFNDGDNNQYAEGGELEAPKHWDKLSLADKSDVMAAAISNGITSLDDIRQAWNDFADNSHEYAKGGYKPSAAIKSEIANWEGSSMKTNRSFEAEAADFNRVIPAAVRSKLTQKQLDALYSYGYNVGMGNLKARVLPTLTAYTQGRVDAGDVASSMWASKDPLMKGLQRRRAWERGMFTGEAPIERQGSIIDRAINMDLSHLPSMYFKGEINNPLIQHPYYTAPKVELPKEESKPVTLEGINKDLDDDNGLSNFFKVQQMMGAVGMDNGLSSNSFLGAWSNFLNGNVFATGGQKGVTSSNGNYHVSPADVANSMWASKDMYLRGLQRRRAWERGMFTDHSPMGRQGSVINDAIHMDLSGLRSLNDNTSNPLWKSNNFTVPKIVLSDEEPAIQRNYDLSFKEEKPIDNFIKLQQIMSAMDNGSDNQQSIVSQANRQMYVANVSSSDNNDTFLDNMWFSKGGYLYDDGGMASIYPTMDNDEHLTNVNAYTTASGHPVEQIGWDDNGYARFRDTVTGDLGKAYEPSEAYTKTVIDLSKIHLAEKPLEEIYPEFDLIGAGGVIKGLTGLVTDYAKRKAAQAVVKKSTEKPFTSELDWSPDSWFGTRSTGAYDAEDLTALKAHIPEYHAIEEEAKRNGTWLKMPDGSTWEGDPRSWVQLQSNDGQKLVQDILYHGDRYGDSENYLGELWGSSSPKIANTYSESTYQLTYPKGLKTKQVDAKGNRWGNIFKDDSYDTNDFVHENLYDEPKSDVVIIKNVLDPGAHKPRSMSTQEYFSLLNQPYNDTVLGPGIPRKSLLGNNGNFDFSNSNIYKGLLPFGLITSAYFQNK